MAGSITLRILREPGPELAPFLGVPEVEGDVGAPVAHRPGKVWVAALDGAVPVACAALFLPGGQAEFGSAYVLPGYRRRGIYGLLVEQRLVMARAAGHARALAQCQPRAAALLARHGWREEGRHWGYRVMVRDL